MGFQLALNHKFASLQACQIENFIKQLLMPTRPNKNEIMGCDMFEDILAFFQASPANIHYTDVEMDLKDNIEDTASNLKELVPQSEDLGKT